MRWKGRRGSSNIEDRRRSPMRSGGGLGIIGILLVLGLGYVFGIDVTPLLQGQGGPSIQQGSAELTDADRRAGEFVSVTLADTEEIWTDVFDRQVGRPYEPAVLVLFKGVTASPCGSASGATGPFYCPADSQAYLDMSFFKVMDRQLGAGGDFAQAYVIAHEIAHHVQNELGVMDQVNQFRQRASTTEANRMSVMVELQADCYSGVWARQAQARFGTLERGDVQEAMNAAKRIGDDALQRNAGRVPQPHTFTHGTSEQRQRWFARGFETGDVLQCDTFGTDRL